MPLVWDNFASAQLAAQIEPVDTTLTVQAGQGAGFPAVGTGDYSIAVLENDLGLKEVVHITDITGDVFTVTRGEEGTAPATFAINSRIELRVTTGFLKAFVAGGTYT